MKKAIIVLIIILIIIITLILGFIFFNKRSEENKVAQNNVENISNVENEIVNNDIENNDVNQNVEISENVTIVKEAKPTGFMGSSFYKVVLYSDKNVYLEVYNGNRNEKSNLIERSLLATDVETIEEGNGEENYGEVIIKGGNIKNDTLGWIVFE